MEFNKLSDFILSKLEKELPPVLTYHGMHHIHDVYQACELLANKEGVTGEDLTLLLTAALFHDSGFIIHAKGHEAISCEYARQYLPSYGYNAEQVERVCGMIMATKLPQSPQNHLEEILCDADLDYLGRDDFFVLGDRLFKEFIALNLVQSEEEWNNRQVEFLATHNYFTRSANELRKAKKEEHLRQLRGSVSATNHIKKHAKSKTANHHPIITLGDIVYILVGVLFAGFALQSFLVPNKFLDGGVTGMSLLVHEIYHVSLGMLLIVANLPFIIMGGYHVNKLFAFKALGGVILLALCLEFVPYPVDITSDKLIVSIFGGFFLGLGVGLGMRGGAAIDGIEVLALYTWRRLSLSMSEIILAINTIIFLIAAFHFGLEIALYAMLTYYIATRTIDYVVEGIEEYTGVTIISAGQSEAIKKKLVMDLNRGITVYKGERGFMKESFNVKHDCDIIFTVITRLEVRRLKKVVYEIDPKAFVITNSIKEAAGGILKRHVSH